MEQSRRVLRIAKDGEAAELDRVERGDEKVVLPVVAEEIEVHKRTVETGGVRLRKVVRERDELVEEPLLREEVHVERVPVNRVIDSPVESRQEGDTLILPVLEEVLVVEKRLMLKEEIRITTKRRTSSEPQHFTLRSEEAVVERLEPDRPGATAVSDGGNSNSRNKGA